MLRLMSGNPHSTGVEVAMIGRLLRPLAFTLIMLTQAAAASPEEQRGKTFALNNCARCHAIDKVSPSPLKIARKHPVKTARGSFSAQAA
jgi:cytochrome c551/c552